MRFWILFLITLTAAVPATAQLPEQSDVLVPVGHWLVQQGDNSPWASPELNDSQWKPTTFPDTDPLFH